MQILWDLKKNLKKLNTAKGYYILFSFVYLEIFILVISIATNLLGSSLSYTIRKAPLCLTLPYSLNHSFYRCLQAPSAGIGWQLDIIGFIIPLTISIYFILSMFNETHDEKKNFFKSREVGLFLLVSVVFAIISYVLKLTPQMTSGSASLNNYYLVLILLFIAYYDTKSPNILRPKLLYFLGFLCAVFSDITTHTWLIWGGLGLFDLDFIMPIAFVLGFLIVKWLQKLLTNKAS